jgi:hypothetical protein
MGAFADGFAAFAQPLLEQTDGSIEQMNQALVISQLCYNLAISPEHTRERTLNAIRPSLRMDDQEFSEFRRTVVEPMLARHRKMFPRLHRRNSSGDLLGGTSPSTQPAGAMPTQQHPVTDRYAPCPCNSGRKYKFCCGAKGR